MHRSLLISPLFGVVVGVVGGLDNTASAIKKQIGLACVPAWFFIALATAFKAANSFLILAFTFKKLTIQKLKAIGCLSALAWVGV